METPNWWPQWLKSLDEISDGKTAKTCCESHDYQSNGYQPAWTWYKVYSMIFYHLWPEIFERFLAKKYDKCKFWEGIKPIETAWSMMRPFENPKKVHRSGATGEIGTMTDKSLEITYFNWAPKSIIILSSHFWGNCSH